MLSRTSLVLGSTDYGHSYVSYLRRVVKGEVLCPLICVNLESDKENITHYHLQRRPTTSDQHYIMSVYDVSYKSSAAI